MRHKGSIVSTRDSVWLGESGGKSLHLYFELAEREQADGQVLAAPLYLEASGVDSDGTPIETSVRLAKETGEKLVAILAADKPQKLRYKVL